MSLPKAKRGISERGASVHTSCPHCGKSLEVTVSAAPSACGYETATPARKTRAKRVNGASVTGEPAKLRRASGPSITTPEEAYGLFSHMAELPVEQFNVVGFDARRRVLIDLTISVGTLTSTLVHPREVFAPALVARCASIMVAHNHPSGDPGPSAEDLSLTRRLKEAGRLLGVDLVDHLIIGDPTGRTRFVSLKQMGEI